MREPFDFFGGIVEADLLCVTFQYEHGASCLIINQTLAKFSANYSTVTESAIKVPRALLAQNGAV